MRSKIKVDGGGLRFNADKDRWDLLPTDAVEQVVKVLTAGAKKYKERNWERGMPWSICQASMARHSAKWAMGARLDAESKLPHMAHVACNAMFLLAYELRGLSGQDDVEPLLRAAVKDSMAASLTKMNLKPRRSSKRLGRDKRA